jgi:hypothetical protein
MSSPTAQMDDWIRAHADLAHKIVIPAKMKWEVRDKLDQANITERVLFPGLDGLSRVLKRYYSPRNVAERKRAPAPADGGDQGQEPDPEDARGGDRASENGAGRAPRSGKSPKPSRRAAASSARDGSGTSRSASAGRTRGPRSTRSARAARGT